MTLFKGKWRVVAGVILLPAALFGGLALFHRHTALGRALSTDGYTMVGTTLIAAALGFGAIMLQIRSSYQALREQIEDQHGTAEEERNRQKRVLAAALFTEINEFNECHIRNEEGILSSPAFTVFQANAARIGEFDLEASQAIVHFYALAGEHAETCNKRVRMLEKAEAPGASQTITASFTQYVERHELKPLKEASEEAMRILRDVARFGSTSQDAQAY